MNSRRERHGRRTLLQLTGKVETIAMPTARDASAPSRQAMIYGVYLMQRGPAARAIISPRPPAGTNCPPSTEQSRKASKLLESCDCPAVVCTLKPRSTASCRFEISSVSQFGSFTPLWIVAGVNDAPDVIPFLHGVRSHSRGGQARCGCPCGFDEGLPRSPYHGVPVPRRSVRRRPEGRSPFARCGCRRWLRRRGERGPPVAHFFARKDESGVHKNCGPY